MVTSDAKQPLSQKNFGETFGFSVLPFFFPYQKFVSGVVPLVESRFSVKDWILAKLHRALDLPVIFYGRYHRILFREIVEASIITRKTYPNDPRAEKSALLHLKYDEVCSADQTFKKALEVKTKQFFKQRKKSKRYVAQLNKMINEDQKKRKKRERKIKKELDKLFELSKPKRKRRKQTTQFNFKF